MQLDTYTDITAEELEQYRKTKKEHDYLLVDVRFPEEYEEEHIPGSFLLPLAELNARLTELPPDRDIIFYCHSGRRSRTAALFATSVPFFQKTIYNLAGGIISFYHKTVPDYPVLHVFDLDADLDNLFRQAINLEKGAEKFYKAVLEEIDDASFRSTIELLGKAEQGHARLIYNLWKNSGEAEASLPPFSELYASLAGDIIEGGEPLEKHLARLYAIKKDFEARLLEIVLETEHAAYDLYRSVAHRLHGSDLENAFLSLAEAEKNHMLLASQGVQHITASAS